MNGTVKGYRYHHIERERYHFSTWPREKRRALLRESTETDGGEEINGKSRVPRVIAREQAFEEWLQSPVEETALIVYIESVNKKTTTKTFGPILGDLRVLESLVELRKPHVGTQLLEEDLDENTAGGRRRLLAHSHTLQDLLGITGRVKAKHKNAQNMRQYRS